METKMRTKDYDARKQRVYEIDGKKISIQRGDAPPPLPRTRGISNVLRSMTLKDVATISGSTQRNVSAIAHQVFGKGNYATRLDSEGNVMVWKLA